MTGRTQGLGIALIVIGAVVLLGRSIDIGTYAWPLFIVLAGAVLLAFAFVGRERSTSLAVPGSVVTTVGLILFVQNLSGYYESWAYAWALILAAVGFGRFLRAAMAADHDGERAGLRMVRQGLVLFAAFGLVFELLIFDGLSGTWLGRWLLPLALIAAGLYLLVRRESARAA